MVMSMVRTITVKLSSTVSPSNLDSEITDNELFDNIMDLYVPLGFVDRKEMMLPVSKILLKWCLTENFGAFNNLARDSLLKNLAVMLTFWLRHPLMSDTFFSQNVVDSLWLLLKSGMHRLSPERFAKALKAMQVTHLLINASKDERVPAQIKSKILKVVKYLANDSFVDTFNPQSLYRPTSRRVQERPPSRTEANKYTPSFGEVSQKAPKLISEYAYNIKEADHEDFMKKVRFDERHGKPNSPTPEIRDYKSSQTKTEAKNRAAKIDSYETNHTFGDQRSHVEKQFDGSDKYNPHYGGGDPQETLYLEYLSLLDNSNTRELLSFAVQNLATIIDDCIFSILQSKPSYLKLLNLVEFNLSVEDRENQKRILHCLAKHLTEERAREGIEAQVIERCLRVFSRQGQDFHELLAALIFAHIVKSNYNVRVNALTEMMKTPYIGLQDLAIKILRDISKPSSALPRDYSLEFENHLRFLLEASLTKDRSLAQINSLIEILANLCINDYLCPELIHHNGVETLLYHLREKANLEGQRFAARGLLNLGAKNSTFPF